MCEEESFLYFAYGSNMLPARLAARCPSARPLAPASLARHALAFAKPGRDGSAKATITARRGARVPGALFTIARCDLESLDQAEGRGKGYERVEITLPHPQESAPLKAMTYIATAPRPGLIAFDWYLALVIAGRRHFALPADDLAAIPWQRDPLPGRPARREGIRALKAAGLHRWAALLPPDSGLRAREAGGG